MLVHGAFADGSSWDAVVSRLQSEGYTVYVPPNPLQGLSYDSAYLADFRAEPGSCAVPANLTLVPYPGAPEGTADVYIKLLCTNSRPSAVGASEGRLVLAA